MVSPQAWMAALRMRPFLALDPVRLGRALCAALYSSMVGVVDVGHPEGDVLHAVAVLEYMLGNGPLGKHGGGEHEAYLLLLQHVRGAVAHFGLRSRRRR